MIEAVVLEVVDVRNCATGNALAFMVMNTRARYPTAEQVLTLEPGFWYGRHVHLPLFGPRRGYLAAYRHGRHVWRFPQEGGAEPGLEEESPAFAAAEEELRKERTPGLDGAELLRRTFALDVFASARCGGRRRVLAYP